MPQKNITLDAIFKWDVTNWSESLAFWERNCGADFKGAKVLEIGSSLGGLSLWAASKNANVICSDLTNPGETAKSFHDQFSFSGSISYQAIDATNIPFENYFDIILFKSVLGGVGRDSHPERQQKMIDEIYKALKAGGCLLFAENLKASFLHQYFRKKFVRWGTQWRYITIPEMTHYSAGKFELKYSSTGFWGAFGRSESQRKFLSLFDKLIFNKLISQSAKYVLYGVARKV
ncbi:MAG: class I SAM-dependent methyltransferase [Calditrichaeota bacterium]|nr:class I SAM-dependent methyltransferase [Calditrichota bacterium]